MHSELHGNVVHHGVELLLLVSVLFLLAIPKSLLILKEVLYTSILYHGMVWKKECCCIIQHVHDTLK